MESAVLVVEAKRQLCGVAWRILEFCFSEEVFHQTTYIIMSTEDGMCGLPQVEELGDGGINTVFST